MKQLFFVALLASLFLTCNQEQEEDMTSSSADVFIRIENASIVNYTDILVKLDQDHLYEDLIAGEISEYQKFDRAYRYAYVELMVDGVKLVIQPIDYVGETELDDGYYTYIISLNESTTGLSLEFRED